MKKAAIFELVRPVIDAITRGDFAEAIKLAPISEVSSAVLDQTCREAQLRFRPATVWDLASLGAFDPVRAGREGFWIDCDLFYPDGSRTDFTLQLEVVRQGNSWVIGITGLHVL